MNLEIRIKVPEDIAVFYKLAEFINELGLKAECHSDLDVIGSIGKIDTEKILKELKKQ